MTPIRTLRDDFALAAFGAAMTADLIMQSMMRETARQQGLVANVQGRPIANMVQEAYRAADAALEIRQLLPAQTLTDAEIAILRGQRVS